MFLSIYPKRTKLISIDSKLYMLAKRKTVFFFSPVLLLWLESFCYLCTWSPPQSDFFVFFVTILLPTISNRWAFTLIIRAILCCMYNVWQNISFSNSPSATNDYIIWMNSKATQWAIFFRWNVIRTKLMVFLYSVFLFIYFVCIFAFRNKHSFG